MQDKEQGNTEARNREQGNKETCELHISKPQTILSIIQHLLSILFATATFILPSSFFLLPSSLYSLMNITDLKKLYCGFYIDDPTGNNAFSFKQRQCRKIFVPSLINGAVSDVMAGREIVFSEIDEGVEYNRAGLRQFVYFEWNGCPVFVFDNHNHAFAFWMAGWRQGVFPAGSQLLHVDQHTDMREPAERPPWQLADKLTLAPIFHYANYQLNVGNFIQPALQLGLFSEVQIIDSSTGFEEAVPDKYVLDIDLDIFAPEMNYIDNQYKIARIRGYLNHAQLITVASSPYFIEQDLAIGFLHKIFAH